MHPSKEDSNPRSTGVPPLTMIDCPTTAPQSSTCSTAEAILLRTDVLSLQRMNRNLEHQVEDLKDQLHQVTAELQEAKKRYTRDMAEMERELGLKEEVLDEAVVELDAAKERISLLEKENAMLLKKKESRLELSELTNLLHIMDSKATPMKGSLLRDFSESETKEETTSDSPAQFILKRMGREEMLDGAQTSGVLDALRSTLAFWKKNESSASAVTPDLHPL